MMNPCIVKLGSRCAYIDLLGGPYKAPWCSLDITLVCGTSNPCSNRGGAATYITQTFQVAIFQSCCLANLSIFAPGLIATGLPVIDMNQVSAMVLPYP